MYTRNNKVHMNLESKDFINEGRTLKRYVELKIDPCGQGFKEEDGAPVCGPTYEEFV